MRNIFNSSRRNFLRGTGGALLVLPFLESFAANTKHRAVPKRLVCTGILYSLVPSNFFPNETGRNYKLTPLLKPLSKHRNKFTVFSQLDHGPEGVGGHLSVHTYLSGINSKNAKNYSEANISIDQKAAEFAGTQTRYSSMQFGLSKAANLSWTRSGISLSPMTKPNEIFKALFINDSAKQKKELLSNYSVNQSILDSITENAKNLEKSISKDDREKLDQYFTSIRSIEKRIGQSELWIHKNKPAVPGGYKLPANISEGIKDKLPVMFDLITLALQTDSTRSISFNINAIGSNGGGLPGITKTWHTLTHHGKDRKSLDPLGTIEKFIMLQFNRFLTQMDSIVEANGKTLLDNTMCLFGSGLGNASSHSNADLPILLAGGGFQHKGHLKYKKDKAKRLATPLCQLYVTMLQHFGLEVDKFGTASGRISGFAGA